MSFKNFDRQTFIADAANAFTQKRISKREFLRKMGIAGVGFSAFSESDSKLIDILPIDV